MNKDTINKVLVALAAVFTVFGVANLAGASNFLIDNLDSLWAAVAVLVGVVVGFIGLFKKEPVPAQLKSGEVDVKSVVYTVLVALGAVATFLGLAKLTDIVNFLLVNLDSTYAALMTVAGILAGLVAYFKKQIENEGA